MADTEWLADAFEQHRDHLRAVAYRLLGSVTDADDAVQDTWLRLTSADTSEVENLGGWLTTIVARVSLNTLRARRYRHEELVGDSWSGTTEMAAQAAADPSTVTTAAPASDPAEEAVLADSVGLALLVVLDTLTPAERLAFVLHDMFAMPFTEVAAVLERSPAATRQLASRARRRVQGADTAPDADLTRRREVIQAFLAASRNGDLGALVAVLDPDVVVRADHAVVRTGAEPEVRGADAVAAMFFGRARAAKLALINGITGVV